MTADQASAAHHVEAGRQLREDMAAFLAAEGDTPRAKLLTEALDVFDRLTAILVDAMEQRAAMAERIAALLSDDWRTIVAAMPSAERRRTHRPRHRRCR